MKIKTRIILFLVLVILPMGSWFGLKAYYFNNLWPYPGARKVYSQGLPGSNITYQLTNYTKFTDRLSGQVTGITIGVRVLDMNFYPDNGLPCPESDRPDGLECAEGNIIFKDLTPTEVSLVLQNELNLKPIVEAFVPSAITRTQSLLVDYSSKEKNTKIPKTGDTKKGTPDPNNVIIPIK